MKNFVVFLSQITMQSESQILAPGLNLFPSLKPPNKTLAFHQISVLILTFLAYASFHASRKPPSIVRSVLGPKINSNSTIVESNLNLGESNSSSIDTGWAPFDGPEGTHRLGELDLAFLSAYSIGMYFAGHVGDRIDLRLFLVFGMMGSGILTIIFGLGYWFSVHVLWFFMAVQVVCGIFQSIGWPCVVAVVGNWFGKSKRGLIMGVWTSHTSVGNIIGSVVASGVLEFGWGWSFMVPGLLVIFVGILVFLFLVVSPEDMGFKPLGKEIEMNVEVGNVENSKEKVESEKAGLLETGNTDSLDTEDSDSLQIENSDSSAPIGFLDAWRLPGVAPFAFCLFFSKLVAYTFLYWLPFYLRHTGTSTVSLTNNDKYMKP